jgi:hypothetical protein
MIWRSRLAVCCRDGIGASSQPMTGGISHTLVAPCSVRAPSVSLRFENSGWRLGWLGPIGIDLLGSRFYPFASVPSGH